MSQPLKLNKLNSFGQNAVSFNKTLRGTPSQKPLYGWNPTPVMEPKKEQKALTLDILAGKSLETMLIQTRDALARVPGRPTIPMLNSSKALNKHLQNNLNSILLKRYQKIQNMYLPAEEKDKLIAEALMGLKDFDGAAVAQADSVAESILSGASSSTAPSEVGALLSSFSSEADSMFEAPVDELDTGGAMAAASGSAMEQDAASASTAPIMRAGLTFTSKGDRFAVSGKGLGGVITRTALSKFVGGKKPTKQQGTLKDLIATLGGDDATRDFISKDLLKSS